MDRLQAPGEAIAITPNSIYINTKNEYTRPTVDEATRSNKAIELFRILATCGVVWFHMDSLPFRRVAYSGLIFFIITATILQIQRTSTRSSLLYLSGRTTRLIVPWAFWFFVYAVVNVFRGKPAVPQSLTPAEAVLAGPWIGLWYLPFAYMSAIFVQGALNSLLQLRPSYRIPILTITTVGCFLTITYIRLAINPSPPWAQWSFGLPAILCGIGIGLVTSCDLYGAKTVAVFYISLGLTLTLAYLYDPGLSIPYAIGLLVTATAFSFKIRCPSLKALSQCCFGVYLVHGLIIGATKMIPSLALYKYLWFMTVILLSFASVWALRKFQIFSRLT